MGFFSWFNKQVLPSADPLALLHALMKAEGKASYDGDREHASKLREMIAKEERNNLEAKRIAREESCGVFREHSRGGKQP